MKKISLIKIIVALFICNVYVFTCGVMGVIEDVPVSAQATEQAPSPDEGANGQGTVDFIILDSPSQSSTGSLHFMNFLQPEMADKPVYTTISPVDGENPDVQDNGNAEIVTDTSKETIEILELPDETIEEPERTPETTPATTTTPAATTTPATTTTPSTTPATTTTPAPATTTTPSTTTKYSGIPVDDTTVSTTTTTPSTTPPTEPEDIVIDPNAASEILTVNNNGTIVSGNAIDIVSRITQNEVGYAFAPEAIKAQAVAAYTYVKLYNENGSYPQVILSDNVNESVRVLVSSVIGQAVRYNGQLIQAVYSASSAGYTASSLTVWGNEYPYLTSKYCELDALYDPNYGRTAQFTSADIKSRVYNATGISLEGDPSTWFVIEEYLDNVYVGQMNIGGYHSYVNNSGKSVKLTGKVFRDTIMNFGIRSYAFDIDYDEGTDTFTFTTYGYGHGVGLSQNGANALATYWGFDYKQILKFYYTGCEVY